MLLPTNLSAPAAAARRFARFCRESADVRKPFVQTSTTDRTPHLTIEPFVSTGTSLNTSVRVCVQDCRISTLLETSCKIHDN